MPSSSPTEETEVVLLRRCAFQERPFADDSPWNTKAALRPEDDVVLRTLAGVAAALKEFELQTRFQDLPKQLEEAADPALLMGELAKQLVNQTAQVLLPTLNPRFGFDEYTMPIFEASAGLGQFDCAMEAYDGFRCTECNSECRPTTFDEPAELGAPVPPDCNGSPQNQRVIKGLPMAVEVRPGEAIRPSGPTGIDSDGSCTLVDFGAQVSYDFWQAAFGMDGEEPIGGGRVGTRIVQAGGLGKFPLRGSGAQKIARGKAARATGLPLLGGLLLPEDFAHGPASVIEHAFAFAMPGARYLDPEPPEFRNWVYPASNTERTNSRATPFLLCGGQRIVLHDEVRDSLGRVIHWQEENRFPPMLRIVLRAMRDYGAYLVDGAKGLAFYAEDYHTANWQVALGEGNGSDLVSDTAKSRMFELLFLPEDCPDPKDWLTVDPGRVATPWHLLMLGLNDLLHWRLGHYVDDSETNSGLPFSVEVSGRTHFNFRLAEDLPTPP